MLMKELGNKMEDLELQVQDMKSDIKKINETW